MNVMARRAIKFSISFACLLCVAASAQRSSGDTWTVPVTQWGDPDLRGTWPIRHLIGIPLERPERFGERRLMTDEEFAEVEQRVNERNVRYDEEIEGNRMGIGHWAEPTEALRLTSLIVDPPDGRLPELTEAGRVLRATMGSSWHNTVFDSLADFDAWDRCISRGMPVSMLPRNYNNGIRILQSPGYVAMQIEMLGMRVIPLGDQPAVDPAVTAWLGESRGYWEGDTLVVETTNYNGKSGLTNFGVPGSPREPYPSTTGLRTVERFTRIDGATLEYQITMEDPEVLTRPFTIAYPMWRDDDYELFEYACHEGNTAVRYYIETSRYERAR
jgi:hypothetical protein